MGELPESEITVVATEPADKVLMEELLRRAGLRPEVNGDAQVAEVSGGDGPIRRRPNGGERPYPGAQVPPITIVCHREAEGPRPPMPTAREAGAVLVFSDSKQEQIVVETLEAGAHHFFDIGESPRLMQERLTAALRSRLQCSRGELRVKPFRFDLGNRCAWRDDRLIALSPKEFDLAYYLFFHRGRTVGNCELMTAVWSLPRTMDTRRIDTAACRLRKKMGLEAPDGLWRLKRLRSEGYKLIPVSAKQMMSAQA